MNAIAAAVQASIVGIPGIVDSNWLTLTSGITVLTGRNNVGKTRILRTVATLRQATDMGARFPHPPPGIRICNGGDVLEVCLTADGFPDHYVADVGGRHYDISWQRRDNTWIGIDVKGNQHSWTPTPPHIATLQSVVPEYKALVQAIDRLVYLPPQRTVAPTVPTVPVMVPQASGSDLANVLYTHRNENTPQWRAVEAAMSRMFPEIEHVLTPPTAEHQVTVKFQDRFSGQNVPLDEAGTGLAQALYFIAMVLMSPPGRIFLVDEPHVYLHPGAERLMVEFLREHEEHSYVCATHSPVFINAAEPEKCWLVSRDKQGSQLRSLFDESLSRTHILADLGTDPGDVALAERILFVEGPSDREAYPILLRRLGYDVIMRNCSVIDLRGAGSARPLAGALDELSRVLHTKFTVCLDGDRVGQQDPSPYVRFLPVSELEELFLRDAPAVREGLLQELSHEGDRATKVARAWPEEAVTDFINQQQQDHPEAKPTDVIKGLARKMGTSYNKTVHAPLIAERLSTETIEALRPTFADFFDG